MKNEIDIIRLLKILRRRLYLQARGSRDRETAFDLNEDVIACDFQIQRLRGYVALENAKVKTPLPNDRQFNTLTRSFAD